MVWSGARSEATSAISVVPYTTEPPPPPEVTQVQKLSDPSKRRVEWTRERSGSSSRPEGNATIAPVVDRST